ncbi:iron-sulfur cluster co-chaperone protein HscB isoform X1 [Monodelphis domestica]|uniref:iron-sulfur cluster co-chaperone protein HscB isoform X1 n=1 Tax=Monodelphis domestica TaxID=13616 RepID=UPI0024E25523|nr:iron-sulfur cluster co-chaperone protein HscB isoform X1 [Monodelphis domestica]
MWRGAAGSLRRVWGVPGRPWSSGGNAASESRGTPSCWNCGSQGAPVGGDVLFCSACRALQPPSPEPDFFRLMDCGRSFTVDVRKLQRRYQQLQRQVHPDNFSQKSQTERDFSEQHSTLVNEAYRTLLTPISRGLYLLKLHGMEIPEGTDSGMDMEFLGEIMEVNEKLAEAHSEAATKEIGAFVRAKQKELTEDLAKAFEQGDLQKAKKLLGKMKYFSNLDEKVKIKTTPT